MIFDPEVARDSMATLLADYWVAQDWAAMGFDAAPDIQWQGRGVSNSLSVNKPYIEWQARHNDAPQASFSDSQVKAYDTYGLIIIQSKGPLLPGNGFEVAQRMAIIARDAYRGKQTPDCIWFRNARISEVGADGGWYLFNTYIEFNYSEVG